MPERLELICFASKWKVIFYSSRFRMQLCCKYIFVWHFCSPEYFRVFLSSGEVEKFLPLLKLNATKRIKIKIVAQQTKAEKKKNKDRFHNVKTASDVSHSITVQSSSQAQFHQMKLLTNLEFYIPPPLLPLHNSSFLIS